MRTTLRTDRATRTVRSIVPSYERSERRRLRRRACHFRSDKNFLRRRCSGSYYVISGWSSWLTGRWIYRRRHPTAVCRGSPKRIYRDPWSCIAGWRRRPVTWSRVACCLRSCPAGLNPCRCIGRESCSRSREILSADVRCRTDGPRVGPVRRCAFVSCSARGVRWRTRHPTGSPPRMSSAAVEGLQCWNTRTN